jgi:hypothetical protein
MWCRASAGAWTPGVSSRLFDELNDYRQPAVVKLTALVNQPFVKLAVLVNVFSRWSL